MLVRKLVTKYIESNPYFCTVTLSLQTAAEETAGLLLKNNFMRNQRAKGSKRNQDQMTSSIEYGQNPIEA